MRRTFADLLHVEMQKEDRITVLTADLGFKMWDAIKDDFPRRFHNVGASEQLLISLGIGLAYQGRIPVLYSITPFLLYRPFEILRTYVDHERTPVKLVGSGRGDDYLHDGFTHYAGDDRAILSTLKNIAIFHPADTTMVRDSLQDFLYSPNPCYMNLGRRSSYE